MDKARITPDGTIVNQPQPDLSEPREWVSPNGTKFVLPPGQEPPTWDVDQSGAFLLSPEGTGHFLAAVGFRKANMTDKAEYQQWVDSLDEVRTALLSVYELGYIRGCADQRQALLGATRPTVEVKGGKVKVR